MLQTPVRWLLLTVALLLAAGCNVIPINVPGPKAQNDGGITPGRDVELNGGLDLASAPDAGGGGDFKNSGLDAALDAGGPLPLADGFGEGPVGDGLPSTEGGPLLDGLLPTEGGALDATPALDSTASLDTGAPSLDTGAPSLDTGAPGPDL